MKYVRKDKYTKPATPADVLNLALLKEKSSYDFYVDLIKKTESLAMKKLLEELKNAEWGHIQIIKHRLEE